MKSRVLSAVEVVFVFGGVNHNGRGICIPDRGVTSAPPLFPGSRPIPFVIAMYFVELAIEFRARNGGER